MTTPTISTISPAYGHSGGSTVVRVSGTGFRLPAEAAPPPTGGPVPAPPASVRVFFGATEARVVRVASSTVLYATTERADPAVVDVEVRNVGPYGETIGSEVAVADDAYEYRRPALTDRSDLSRLVRALHAELVRQVLPEVVFTRHVDWTDDPASVLRKIAGAKLPAVFLAGPSLPANTFFRRQTRDRTAGADAGVSIERRAARTVDVVFTIGVVAEKFEQVLALASALEDFVLRNPWIYLPVSEGSETLVRYEFGFSPGGDVTVDSTPDESNVRSASGSVTISGFDVLEAPGFEDDQAMTAHATVEEDLDLGSEPLA